MSAKPFIVDAVLEGPHGGRLRWRWRVVRAGRVIAACSSERYARRIARLLNADEVSS